MRLVRMAVPIESKANVKRCVDLCLGEHTWKLTLQYLSAKKEKYNWLVRRPKDPEKGAKDKVQVFLWWSSKKRLSRTSLHSYREKLRRDLEDFHWCQTKQMRTKSILRNLAQSTETDSWIGSFVCVKLVSYFRKRILSGKKLSEPDCLLYYSDE